MFGWFKSQTKQVAKMLCSCCRGKVPEKGMEKGYALLWRDWDGATLGWSIEPEISIISGYKCEACGEVYEQIGYYIQNIGKRDESGWPLTKAGERMPIAGQTPYREREFTLKTPASGWA